MERPWLSVFSQGSWSYLCCPPNPTAYEGQHRWMQDNPPAEKDTRHTYRMMLKQGMSAEEAAAELQRVYRDQGWPLDEALLASLVAGVILGDGR